MFNENDGKWIGYYKRITVAFFWIYIVAGLFFGLSFVKAEHSLKALASIEVTLSGITIDCRVLQP